MERKKEKVCHVYESTFNINSGVKLKSTGKVVGPLGTWACLEHHLKAAQSMTLNFGCLTDRIPLCFKMSIYMTGEERQEGSLLTLWPLQFSKDTTAGTFSKYCWIYHLWIRVICFIFPKIFILLCMRCHESYYLNNPTVVMTRQLLFIAFSVFRGCLYLL